MRTPDDLTSDDGRSTAPPRDAVPHDGPALVPPSDGAARGGEATSLARYCAHCGEPVPADSAASARFGQLFCSDAHAERFVDAVRTARAAEVARREATGDGCHVTTAALPTAPVAWRDRLQRAACWGGSLLLVVAMLLFWSGNAFAATGGSLLSLLVLLACPLGMFFMMRAMMSDRGGAPGAERSRAALPQDAAGDASTSADGRRTALAAERGKEQSHA